LDNAYPGAVWKEVARWPIAGWQIIHWQREDADGEGDVDECYTVEGAGFAHDPREGGDEFLSVHEAMVAVVAHTYLPHDGIDAWGQALTFFRTIGMHRLVDREWVLVAPPDES
jgi:hypothetical protein